MSGKTNGWILLHRSILDNWVWSEKPFSFGQAWVDLILRTNHEDRKMYTGSTLVTIHRGQMWTSIRHLANRWGWKPEKVISFLRTLEQDKMIVRKPTPKGTLLTIEKYDDFQTLPNTKRNAKGNTKRNAKGNAPGNETMNEQRRPKKEKKEGLPAEGDSASDDTTEMTDEEWLAEIRSEGDGPVSI